MCVPALTWPGTLHSRRRARLRAEHPGALSLDLDRSPAGASRDGYLPLDGRPRTGRERATGSCAKKWDGFDDPSALGFLCAFAGCGTWTAVSRASSRFRSWRHSVVPSMSVRPAGYQKTVEATINAGPRQYHTTSFHASGAALAGSRCATVIRQLVPPRWREGWAWWIGTRDERAASRRRSDCDYTGRGLMARTRHCRRLSICRSPDSPHANPPAWMRSLSIARVRSAVGETADPRTIPFSALAATAGERLN
jgi:hypothetical protein